MREVSRAPITLAGSRYLHVEPRALAESSGDVLIAGAPNYLWTPRGTAYDVARDSVFGAVVPPRGNARIIPSPIDPQGMDMVRASAREEGGWDIVFAELEAPRLVAEDGVVKHLWHGVYDGHRWLSTERIPLPLSGRVRPLYGSELVRAGDTLAVALRFDTRNNTHVLVLRHSGGRWTHEVLPTPGGAYLTMYHSAVAGFMVGVVHPDFSVSADKNSFFLYNTGSRHPARQKVISGHLLGAVHESLLNSDGSVSWLAEVDAPGGFRLEARALARHPASGYGEARVLDVSAAQVAPVGARHVPRLWISDHTSSDSAKELRFVHEDAGVVTTIHRAPNPFTGYFKAIPLAGGDVLVAGPVLDRVKSPNLFTLLLRVRVECATRA